MTRLSCVAADTNSLLAGVAIVSQPAPTQYVTAPQVPPDCAPSSSLAHSLTVPETSPSARHSGAFGEDCTDSARRMPGSSSDTDTAGPDRAPRASARPNPPPRSSGSARAFWPAPSSSPADRSACDRSVPANPGTSSAWAASVATARAAACPASPTSCAA